MPHVKLPRCAALPINRCNLPAQILGGLTFQQQPVPLAIDGVATLHRDLFRRLADMDAAEDRAALFSDYLDVHFRLHRPDEAGYAPGGRGRPKAHWKRVLRGWMFDSDSREGAVLKSWVESRFGLLTRYHGGPIRDFSGEGYLRFLEARARGLYNTNGLEAQLDLVYSYCQYELAKRECEHLRLYRGLNGTAGIEQLAEGSEDQPVWLLNNLNSFSRDMERATEFGDQVAEVWVPRQKIVAFDALFPAMLKGEGEYLVIGGMYVVSLIDG